MPATSSKQKALMCAEAAKPGSTKAKGIDRKAAAEYCNTKGPLPKTAKKGK